MSKIMTFFNSFGIWFKVLISELANNIISVLLVVLIYFMLWFFPQTLDLLLVLNQNNAINFWEIFTLEVPLYFSLLLIISFFIWNAPKYYYRPNYTKITFKNFLKFIPTKHYRAIEKSDKYSYNCKYHVRKILPRILGCLVLFISAFAILNAMKLFDIENRLSNLLNPSNTLAIVTLILILLLEHNIYRFLRQLVRKIPKLNYIITGSIFILFIFILGLGAANNQAEKDLILLFYSNLSLALIFFIVAFNTKDLLTIRTKPFFYGGIIISGILVLLVYIVFNIKPDIAMRLNPLSVLLICLMSLYLISFIFVFIGKKIQFPLFTFVVILGLILSKYNANNDRFDHYELDKTVTSKNDRKFLKAYVKDWINNRKAKIEQAKEDCYPILFVSSEGGGSRAGLWSFLIHSYLSENSNNRYYKDHLFSLTGASGGGVGNAMFFATAQQAELNNTTINYKNTNKPFTYKASTIYSKNYLSTSIVGLLGRDFFKSILSLFPFDNRGELLQNEWQNAYKEVFNTKENDLEKEVLSYYSKSDTSGFVPPLLFMNSTHAQTGRYSVISPVDFGDSKLFSGYFDYIKKLRAKKGDKHSVKLIEAMRINAAFPYLTPAGEVKDVGLFGDSGYYDNIGGTVSTALLYVFKEVLDETPEFYSIKNKVNLQSVLIFSDLDNERLEGEQFKPISQLDAPLKILMNVRSGHTKEQIAKLNEVPLQLRRTYIIPSTKTSTLLQKKIRDLKSEQSDSIKPILALGRYLSGTAIKAMEKSLQLEDVKSRLDNLLYYETVSETKDTIK